MKPFEFDSIISRDGKLTGRATGGNHRCTLEGCNGLRIATRWPDGKVTYPCTKGMRNVSGTTWRLQ